MVKMMNLTAAEIEEARAEAERINAETAIDEALRDEEDARAAAEEREYEERAICGCCNGSGEGRYDGSTCSACRGSGEERDLRAEEEREYERADYEYDQQRDRDLLDGTYDDGFIDDNLPF